MNIIERLIRRYSLLNVMKIDDILREVKEISERGAPYNPTKVKKLYEGLDLIGDCCDENGNLPRLPNGRLDMDAIKEKAYEKMLSELSPGYVPPED
jgi:hypothetical protein